MNQKQTKYIIGIEIRNKQLKYSFLNLDYFVFNYFIIVFYNGKYVFDYYYQKMWSVGILLKRKLNYDKLICILMI